MRGLYVILFALFQLIAPENLRVGGMTTWFGVCESDGSLSAGDPSSNDSNAGYVIGSKSITFTCPGTGNQNVTELGAYESGATATTHVKIAVYDTSNNLVAYTSELTCTGSNGWISATGGSITQVSPLVGGSSYRLVRDVDANGARIGTRSVTSGDAGYYALAYASFPGATLAAMTNYNKLPVLRCGVDPAASGATAVPQMMMMGMG